MRLHYFISQNMEVILQKWEGSTRDAWPCANPDIPNLRDHAREMLGAITKDMQTTRSEVRRHHKSVGHARPSAAGGRVDSCAAMHAQSRLDSGFDIRTLMAEIRALRATVLQLWSQSNPVTNRTQMEELARFNDCVDQLLTEAVLSYTTSIENSRKALLGILGHDLKQPICGVSMMAGLLEGNEKLGETARHMASQIVNATREMMSLLAELLECAGARLGLQPVGHGERNREAMDHIGAANSSRGFALETSGDDNSNGGRPRLLKVSLDDTETAFIIRLPRRDKSPQKWTHAV